MIGAGLSEKLYGGLIRENLRGLLDRAPRVPVSTEDRLVIFSDLHLGNGSPRDDFRPNGELLSAVLREHYLSRGFSLVLNGDIEELQRFSPDSIRARWGGLFSLFDEFRRKTALYKIAGNHDERLFGAEYGRSGELLEAVRFDYHGDTIFVFHGHQATVFFESFNWMSEFFLRSVANTFRIPNFPVAYQSRKRYWTEHRVYDFSRDRGIVSIIGHTHRPLFESLSKIDALKFRIELLCRDYPLSSPSRRAEIEKAIAGDSRELRRLWDRDRRNGLRESLYDSGISVPCLFNSGCGIGKRGVTAIEIAGGRIALVHWFDRNRSVRYLTDGSMASAERLASTDYFRVVIKEDHLPYIFTRIRLLGGDAEAVEGKEAQDHGAEEGRTGRRRKDRRSARSIGLSVGSRAREGKHTYALGAPRRRGHGRRG